MKSICFKAGSIGICYLLLLDSAQVAKAVDYHGKTVFFYNVME